MTTVNVVPLTGYIVQDPDAGDILPPGGRTVWLTDYWARRIRDGDVTVSGSPPPPPPPPPAPGGGGGVPAGGSTGQALLKASTADYDTHWGDLAGSGAGTDLSVTNVTATNLTVASNTGADAVLPASTNSLAGLMTAAQATKLAGVENNATADMTGTEIVSAINTALGSSTWQAGGGGGGGGASVFADLTDAASANLPSVNTPLANALANKANKTGETLTDITLDGKLILTVANMGSATAIDTGKWQAKTISADTTMTYLSTPAAPNSMFGVIYTNDSANARTITIPPTFSEDQQKTITSWVLPGNAVVRTSIIYTGSGYSIKGETWPLRPVPVVYDILDGGSNYTYKVRYWPIKGRVLSIISQCDAGTNSHCDFQMFINSVAVGTSANAVSPTRQIQAPTTANVADVGDLVEFVVTSNAGCVAGQVTILIDPATS